MRGFVRRGGSVGACAGVACVVSVLVIASGVSLSGATAAVTQPGAMSIMIRDLQFSKAERAGLRDGFVRTTVSCRVACRAEISLFVSARTARTFRLAGLAGGVGQGSFRLGAGTSRVHVRLTPTARRAFSRGRTARLRMRIKTTELATQTSPQPVEDASMPGSALTATVLQAYEGKYNLYPIPPIRSVGAELTRADNGAPIVGKLIRFFSDSGEPLCIKNTDQFGIARCDAPLNAVSAPEDLIAGYDAFFNGDHQHGMSRSHGRMTPGLDAK